MKTMTTFLAMNKIYIFITASFSFLLSSYTDLKDVLIAFIIITSIDTITSIHAGAIEKDLKFNPFKSYFWREIKSGLLRVWLRKVFLEYAVYIILAFVIDIFILMQKVKIDFLDFQLNIPIFALWLFIGVELWSIGENISASGGVNWIKRAYNSIEGLIPEKFKTLFKKKKNEVS